MSTIHPVVVHQVTATTIVNIERSQVHIIMSHKNKSNWHLGVFINNISFVSVFVFQHFPCQYALSLSLPLHFIIEVVLLSPKF